MKKILLLEDDPTLSLTMVDVLSYEGFDVDLALNSDDVFSKTYDEKYDLYIFDVNVPGMNGFEILKSLKDSDDNTPAIFLTALVDIASISKGFEVGADDYIKKPFDMDEFIIRVNSKIKIDKTIKYKSITYDPNENILKKDGKNVDLGEVLGQVFRLLITQINYTVDKVQFYDIMENPSDKALRVHITKLKKELDLNIVNIRGVGYRLEE